VVYHEHNIGGGGLGVLLRQYKDSSLQYVDQVARGTVHDQTRRSNRAERRTNEHDEVHGADSTTKS